MCAITYNVHSVYGIVGFKMKFFSGFMIGGGLGAAAVNLTLVPHGYDQGFFVGAVLVFLGAVLSFVEARSQKKD